LLSVAVVGIDKEQGSDEVANQLADAALSTTMEI
jgi:hypothetical protein